MFTGILTCYLKKEFISNIPFPVVNYGNTMGSVEPYLLNNGFSEIDNNNNN